MVKFAKSLETFLHRLLSPQDSCIASILGGKHDAAQKHAIKVCDQQPQYILLSLYMDLANSKRLFLLFLERVVHIDPFFVRILIKDERLSVDELAAAVSRCTGGSFIYKAVRRDWLLRCAAEAPALADAALAGPDASGECDAAKCLDKLIDEIDDFRLYEYALARGLLLSERRSSNYRWYTLLKDKDMILATKMALNTIDFGELRKILSTTGLESTGQPNYDVLIAYLRRGYSEELLQRMLALYTASPSFINHKILLALLIASRTEKNLVLALYVSFRTAFTENYEIDLIHLFLSRYFCLCANTLQLMKQLSIKNIQIYNNAFLWSDPMIVTGDVMSAQCSSLQRNHEHDLATIEQKIKRFMDTNCLGHAVDLFGLRSALKESTAVREVSELKLRATDPRNQYSDLLGENCSYLFNKLTEGHARSGRSCLDTLYSSGDGVGAAELLSNQPIKIESAEFLEFFNNIMQIKKVDRYAFLVGSPSALLLFGSLA
ncbi:hypothetical protein PAPHI01_1170 [Pancytospora philotis]|nr:hypothetical protein PAPHI01_1170 [Pancytospora philotis]